MSIVALVFATIFLALGSFSVYRALKLHLELNHLPYQSPRRIVRQQGVRVMGISGAILLCCAMALLFIA